MIFLPALGKLLLLRGFRSIFELLADDRAIERIARLLGLVSSGKCAALKQKKRNKKAPTDWWELFQH
ncbi:MULTISPECIES: hypothetical protein [Microcoleaceae]|uniref:hypothetical protein n=1 Tax=Microcoleaceae TaxID=1892252 RepID=UPI00187DEC95|nr:hypothetical protein [Tychonema sp. LEGE 06208]MBE9165274.1 hypothetical protein [Tychonema sp. LEGE 06208]